MGVGYSCRCNKCGYSFHTNLGIGFLFPVFYEETINEMKRGTYGIIGKKFLEEYPDGAIDCEREIARCETCGECGVVPDLTMYIPKKKIKRKDYYMKDELKKSFIEYAKYEHCCPSCKGKAEIIEQFEELLEQNKLSCTKCGGTFEMEGSVMWD